MGRLGKAVHDGEYDQLVVSNLQLSSWVGNLEEHDRPRGQTKHAG